MSNVVCRMSQLVSIIQFKIQIPPPQLSDRLLAKLEESEYCSLSVEDKLEVLVALVERILNSYSVADHMEKKLDESKAAYKHRIKVEY